MSGAFNGNPKVKESLLARLPAACQSPQEKFRVLNAVFPNSADTVASDAFGKELGLHTAFIEVVKQVGFYYCNLDLCTQVFEAMRPGTDTLKIIRRWLLAVETKGSPSLRDRIQDSEALAGADQIAALHRAAIAGEKIDRRQWRQARATLARKSGMSIEGLAIACLLAGAWDLDETPGAATDLVLGYARLVYAEVDQKFGWTAEDDKRAMEQSKERNKAAAVFAGPAPEGADRKNWVGTEEGKAWTERYTEGVKIFNAANPSPALERESERSTAILNTYVQAGESLLRAAAAGPVPVNT